MTILMSHLGQSTTRTAEGIHKQANLEAGEERHEMRVAAIHREAMVLEHLAGSGVAPELLAVGDDWSLQEDLGDTVLPDNETLRRSCTLLLAYIRDAGVHHGDLTAGNLIIRGDRAWAVDWQEAAFEDEDPLQPKPRPDAFLVWRTLTELVGSDQEVADSTRMVRRWQAVRSHLPKDTRTLLDLGTFQGDFPAMAATEGIQAVGVDRGNFRSGEDSIAIGKSRWSSMPDGPSLVRRNIISWREWWAGPDPDVILLFSTWSYFLEDCQAMGTGPLDRQAGALFLRDVAARCRVLFFETQLFGDGPGPPWLRTDGDILAMLEALGLQAEAIANIPVTGRPASRTVWRVTT